MKKATSRWLVAFLIYRAKEIFFPYRDKKNHRRRYSDGFWVWLKITINHT